MKVKVPEPTLVTLRLAAKRGESLKRAKVPEKVVLVLSQPVVSVMGVTVALVTMPEPARLPIALAKPFMLIREAAFARFTAEIGEPAFVAPNCRVLPAPPFTVVVPE